MKNNDIRALHDQTRSELEQKLVELQRQLVQAQLKLKVGKLEDVRLPKKLRADVSRVKTVLRQQELQAAAPTKVKADKKSAAKKVKTDA